MDICNASVSGKKTIFDLGSIYGSSPLLSLMTQSELENEWCTLRELVKILGVLVPTDSVLPL
jgi:hypothetical protein